MKTGVNNEETNRKFLWFIGLAISLLILTAYLFRHTGSGPEGKGNQNAGKLIDEVATVEAVSATQGDFSVYLTGLGTVTPLRTVTVRSRVDGELLRVAFKEGQMVTEGDLLAQIDPRAFQAQLTQSEGQLLRDEALLQNAKVDLVRYKTLLDQDSIAAQQAVTQEWLVKQYQGTVEMDRGLVANAKLQVSYARITSPITGRIGIRLVDQGNIVHAADTGGLAVITQIQPIAVIFTLPEDTVPTVMKQFNSGRNIAIEAYDRSGNNKLADGQLWAMDNQIDTTTGTVKLKGQFANEDMALFANQFVNIKMHMDTLYGITIMPTAAIQRGVAGTFVYVVNDNLTVNVRPVKLGPTENDKVAVLNGVQPNERVVVDGADNLRDNMKVKLPTRDVETGAGEIPASPGKRQGEGT